MEAVQNLSEDDFTKLVNNLNRIMQIAEKKMCQNHMSVETFQVYKIARDAMDLLSNEITSREVIRKLRAEPTNVAIPSGIIEVPYELMQYIQSGVHRIEAIKESRTVLGLGLKEAKDLVDKIIDG